ncbi:MAG: 50S ribosomal protein L4 [Candidatus Spechtbacterales bacterium]
MAIEIPIVDKAGKQVASFQAPEALFGAAENNDLVYQAYTVKIANQHGSYAHTKTRSEVRGGGKKPWRQKGTGRARHGSSRSPIWVGGGITFGPRAERVFGKSIPKKMNRKALAVVLSDKVRRGDLIVVDSLVFEDPKTKQGVAVLKALKQHDRSAVVYGTKEDSNFMRVFGNIEGAYPVAIDRINIVDLLHRAGCVFSKDALESLVRSLKGDVEPKRAETSAATKTA